MDRNIKYSSVLLACALPAIPSMGADSAKKPNVILIMADDMGFGDTGFSGSDWIKTPCMDRLAKDGVVFNRFYAGAPVSSPTRCSALTGRHPHRSGVFNANTGILRPEEVTIAEILKGQGYSTGFFGKWHLGTLTYKEKDANRGNVGNTREYNPPVLHGFDVTFASESKVPTWDPMKQPDQDNNPHSGWKYIDDGDDWRPFGTSYFDTEGNKVTDNLDGDDSRVIMDRAIDYIGKAAGEDRPFFSVIWFHTPHLPVVAGKEFYEMYDGELVRRNYAGSITAMDLQIGRLADYLKELGIDEDTIIFFCSDNGPENGTPGSSAGLQGRKRSLHEGGVREPGFVVWKGHIAPDVTDYPCSTLDYLPTILDLTGTDMKAAPYQLDGISLYPLLVKGKQKTDRNICFMYQNQAAVVGMRYKLYMKKDKVSLYDLSNDMGEKDDIAEQNKGIVRKMMKIYDRFEKSCKASFMGEEYGTESYNRLEQKWDRK